MVLSFDPWTTTNISAKLSKRDKENIENNRRDEERLFSSGLSQYQQSSEQKSEQ